MKPSKQWTTSLAPDEAVERPAQACVALDKIAHYTCHDELYYGSPIDFDKAAIDKVMEPSKALPDKRGRDSGADHVTPESTGEEHRQWADAPGKPGLYLVRHQGQEFAVHLRADGEFRGNMCGGNVLEMKGAKWSLVEEGER